MSVTDQAAAGAPLVLTSMAYPNNATFKAITWSVTDSGDTGEKNFTLKLVYQALERLALTEQVYVAIPAAKDDRNARIPRDASAFEKA